jgi:quinol monooxygenase YgiN
MVVLIAEVNVTNGKCEEFEKEFHKLALKVRKDPGAIAYGLHRHATDPNQYLVYEKYKDNEAVKYHAATPHFQEFVKKTSTIIAKPPKVNAYQETDV